MTDEASAATVIRYSSLNLLWYLLLFVGFEVGAMYTLWTVRPLGIGAPFIFLIGIVCPFVIYRQARLLLNNQPQLTVSNQGICLASGPLDAWENIQGEEVRKVRRGRGTDTVLYYTAGEEERQLNIRELEVSSSQLEVLLRQHRAQFHELHDRSIGSRF